MFKTVCVFLIVLVLSIDAKTVYVDGSVSTSGDGLTPTTAKKTIAEGIALAANNDVVSVASGTYSESALTLNGKKLDIIAPNGATLSGGSSFGCISYRNSSEGGSIQNFVIDSYQTTAISVLGGASLTLTNCKITNNFDNTVAGLRVDTGSSAVVNNCEFWNNGFTAILTISATVTVLNSKFLYNQNGGVSNVGGGLHTTTSTTTVNNTLFISNEVAFYAQGGTARFYNNNFFRNSPFGSNTIFCEASPSVSQSGNVFCGADGNKIRTGCGWSSNPPLTTYDGCGICNGNNQYKDCNGQCFQNATSCNARKTIWVKPGASVNGDGKSKKTPMNSIPSAVTSASYRDTIIIVAGTYTVNTNARIRPNGKAITITSEHGQPQNTVFNCGNSGSVTPLVFTSDESYDTVIKGILFKDCPSLATMSSAAPTIQDCYFLNSGGISVFNSFPIFNNNDFIGSQAVVGGALDIGVTNTSFYSQATVTYCRFRNCVADNRGGAINVQTFAALYLYDSFFIDNSVTVANGTDLYLEASVASVIRNNSFYTTTVAFSSVFCGTAVSVTASSNRFCGSGSYVSGTCITPGSGLVPDVCYACNGQNKTYDCNGVCFGRNTQDSYGGCCYSYEVDCSGRCNGSSVLDQSNVCCAPPSKVDCNNTCGGTARNDKFSVCCAAANIDRFNICCSTPVDCNGTCNGTFEFDKNNQCCNKSTIDVCRICNGDGYSCTTCPYPCYNGGFCDNSRSVCTCVNGYYGLTCTNYSCTISCNGGKCVGPNQCDCSNTNGIAPNCLPATNCGNITCYNNGTCNGSSGCNCDTPKGYYGTNCQNYTCTTPCQNGGICVGPNACDCTKLNDYYGQFCDRFDCVQGCKNGGVCTAPNVCSCVGGYTGYTCDTPPSYEGDASVKQIGWWFALMLAIMLYM